MTYNAAGWGRQTVRGRYGLTCAVCPALQDQIDGEKEQVDRLVNSLKVLEENITNICKIYDCKCLPPFLKKCVFGLAIKKE